MINKVIVLAKGHISSWDICIDAIILISFVGLCCIRSIRKWMLLVAFLLMLATMLVSAFYVMAQGSSSYKDGCNKDYGHECQGPSSPVSAVKCKSQENPACCDQAKKCDPDTIAALSLATARAGNDIMRRSLDVQIAATAGGFVAAAMGLLAAFITVFGYLDADDFKRSRREITNARRHQSAKQEKGDETHKSTVDHFSLINFFVAEEILRKIIAELLPKKSRN